MPPRVLVFQHVSYCPLGTFGEALARDRIVPEIVNLHLGEAIPDLGGYDALFVLGGPQNVWEVEQNPWLGAEIAAIREWVSVRDKPLLGICLGHQLLAEALGGRVGPSVKAEAGLREIEISRAGAEHPIMQGFGPAKRAIHFHGAEVKSLPQDAVVLAGTRDCPIAAFSVGSAAIGIQYHAEANDVLIEEWTDLPAGRALVEGLHGAGGVAEVRDEVARAMPELRANAERLYANFMHNVRAGK